MGLSAGDQVLLTAGAHAAVVDELVDLQAARKQRPWTAAQESRYRELRVSEHELRVSHARALRRFKAYRVRRAQLATPAAGTADDATLAVVAHGLLGAVSVIQGAASMLIGRSADLAPDKQLDLLEMIDEQAALLGGVLQDMVRGLPTDLVDGLQQVAEPAL